MLIDMFYVLRYNISVKTISYKKKTHSRWILIAVSWWTSYIFVVKL